MNILPKKRWHVRTKENIARVRRDEAKAEEEEREKQRRIKLADQEARMTLLRQMAVDKLTDEQKTQLGNFQEFQTPKTLEKSEPSQSTHVNFFEELEAGESGTSQGNVEREKEKKQEQEEYEKKIGLLTYLGQDTNELTGEQSWWQKIDRNNQTKTEDKTEKLKDMLDPLSSVRKYLGTEGVKSVVKKSKHKEIECEKHSKHKKSKKKHKKEKKSKKSKSKKKSRRKSSDTEEDLERVRKQQKLEKLRQERLNREMKERAKANHVLYGIPIEEKTTKGSKKDESNDGERKYNSQFNPHLAKQNKLDAKEKYWLK